VAELTTPFILGVDVSKQQLHVFDWVSQRHFCLDNDAETIRRFLRSLRGPVRLAVEPTSTYHLTLVEEAHALGCEVFLVNQRQLRHYRDAIGARNKTDPDDAWLLARYLAHEAEQLRPYRPLSGKAQQLWALLKRRALLVSTQTQLRQSLADVNVAPQALWREFARLLRHVDQQLLELIRELGWQDAYQRCRSIPGIGPLNAAALVAAFHRGAFSSADAFIAYLGLDVRLRDSGQLKGKRKLTKRGEAEIRRLLFCATQEARRRYAPFAAYLQRQLDKGLSKTAARVVLARKLARIAFALLSSQQSFQPATP
jgi:transposase